MSASQWTLRVGMLVAAAAALACYASASVSYEDLFEWWDGNYRIIMWLAVAALGTGAPLLAALLLTGVSASLRALCARRSSTIPVFALGHVALHSVFLVLVKTTNHSAASVMPETYIWICLSLVWTLLGFWWLYAAVAREQTPIPATQPAVRVSPIHDPAQPAKTPARVVARPVAPRSAAPDPPAEPARESEEPLVNEKPPRAPETHTFSVTIERGSKAAGTQLSRHTLPVGAIVVSIYRNDRFLNASPDTILAVADSLQVTAPTDLESTIRAIFT